MLCVGVWGFSLRKKKFLRMKLCYTWRHVKVTGFRSEWFIFLKMAFRGFQETHTLEEHPLGLWTWFYCMLHWTLGLLTWVLLHAALNTGPSDMGFIACCIEHWWHTWSPYRKVAIDQEFIHVHVLISLVTFTWILLIIFLKVHVLTEKWILNFLKNIWMY